MQLTHEKMFPVEQAVSDVSPHDQAVHLPDLPRQSLSADTIVQTEDGLLPLASVRVGQRLRTRLGTLEPVTRITRYHFTLSQLHDQPEAAPIRFDEDALPDLQQDCAVLMSADCPITRATSGGHAETYPASAFCDGGAIRRVLPEGGIDFIRVHLDSPHQISAGGIWVELDKDARPVSSKVAVPHMTGDRRVFRPIHG
ncbi:Hint domain-containing protein [Gymnodinialimonas ceratoperidinii]|uniref:Hint domain-containing protein n=1 Tax=Gymnodinialimonas ceratoperidinii TaxID=2856823 RepID=A0A8F6TWX7_9RHOB|nr:Hint domain-containing protein [Gymnodinialimonas ceratoperidinii]QXT39226.1 Hint domain-containing protein [Gymnodinialimonas ceratoperidinii]